jgi:hypothetical protein
MDADQREVFCCPTLTPGYAGKEETEKEIDEQKCPSTCVHLYLICG